MDSEQNKYWSEIEQFIRDEFQLEPEIHNILFLIGVQELDYGFQKLNQETKTKVINFATIFILKYLEEEDRKTVQKEYEKGDIKESDSEEEIYKFAIINYFREKKII